MIIDYNIKPEDLKEKLDRFWNLSGEKILRIESEYNRDLGAPIFTVNGKYTSRGWTEWTQGFQYGSAILQFDATGDESFLKIGRENTVDKMAHHVSHVGVHDHGFNNISTCLLYTSDAADDLLCVDLGGRRIIKKKKKK